MYVLQVAFFIYESYMKHAHLRLESLRHISAWHTYGNFFHHAYEWHTLIRWLKSQISVFWICITRRILKCDMPYSHVSYDSFPCAPCLGPMCDEDSALTQVAGVRVSHMYYTSHFWMWHASSTRGIWLLSVCVPCPTLCVTQTLRWLKLQVCVF